MKNEQIKSILLENEVLSKKIAELERRNRDISMNSVNEKKEMSQYKKAIVKLNEIAQIKRNVSQPESLKTSVEPPTPTSAKESFKCWPSVQNKRNCNLFIISLD